MAHPTRRRFLLAGLTVSAALVPGWGRQAAAQGLDQFASGPAPCKADAQPTPAAPEGPDFRAGSPERSSLRIAGVTGTPLVVTGTVSGLTCGPITHALLDFWQADAAGAYDTTGFRLRGRQFSDASGRYRLDTIVPGPHDSRAACLHVKVQPQGKATFTTQLFLSDDARTKTDPQFKPELVMKVTGGPAGKTAVFDIVLNI
jgi:protocatechuate 3,4-dioxygenase beta subunit